MLFLLIALAAGTLTTSAIAPSYELGPSIAHVMRVDDGGQIVCTASHPKQGFLRPARQHHPTDMQYLVDENGETDVILSFDPNTPDEARPALQAGADIWASYLEIKVPLTIHVEWKDLSVDGYLAYALAPLVCSHDPPRCDTFSLANQIHGEDWFPDRPDMTITFNSDVSWHYGLDGEAPDGDVNLISVLLHEIGHGLGFSTSLGLVFDNSDQAGYYETDFGATFTYDKFMWTPEHGQLLDQEKIDNPSVELKQAITGGSLYWGGPGWTNTRSDPMQAAEVSEGEISLWAPWFYDAGGSLSHLDGNDHPQEIMSYYGLPRDPDTAPSPVVLAMLHDMGWELQPRALERSETCGGIEKLSWQDRFTWSLKARVVPGQYSPRIQWVLEVENVSVSDLSWEWIRIDFLDADGFQVAQDEITTFTAPILGDPEVSADSAQTWRGEIGASDAAGITQISVASPEGEWEVDGGGAPSIDVGTGPAEDQFRWAFRFRQAKDFDQRLDWQFRIRNLSSKRLDWSWKTITIEWLDADGYRLARSLVGGGTVEGNSTRIYQGLLFPYATVSSYRVTVNGEELEGEEDW